jgi:hypothetical protein
MTGRAPALEMSRRKCRPAGRAIDQRPISWFSQQKFKALAEVA